MTEKSTALSTIDSGASLAAFVPQNMAEAMQLAKLFAGSALIPNSLQVMQNGQVDHEATAANVFWAMAYGAEVGLTPVNAMQSIYVVHGRPGMYADAMVALVWRSGLCEAFEAIEVNDERARYRTKRKGQSVRELEIDLAYATKAGWTTNAKYKSEPRAMLAARCKSTLCKDVYPDVLRGMTSVEEILDTVETSPGTFTVAPPAPAQNHAAPQMPQSEAADPVESGESIPVDTTDAEEAEAMAAERMTFVERFDALTKAEHGAEHYQALCLESKNAKLEGQEYTDTRAAAKRAKERLEL